MEPSGSTFSVLRLYYYTSSYTKLREGADVIFYIQVGQVGSEIKSLISFKIPPHGTMLDIQREIFNECESSSNREMLSYFVSPEL